MIILIRPLTVKILAQPLAHRAYGPEGGPDFQCKNKMQRNQLTGNGAKLHSKGLKEKKRTKAGQNRLHLKTC
jgi:hypothetical protein